MKNAEHSLVSRPLRLYGLVAVIGILSLVTLALAGFGTRLGIWHFRTGFTILKYAAFAGMAASFGAAICVVAALRTRWFRGTVLSIVALACGVTAFGVPLSWKLKVQRYPRIHDISTDTVTPPDFQAIIPYRGGPVPYGGPGIAALQEEAYPEIRTIVLPFPAEHAFKVALQTAKEMGWEIFSVDPYHGRIEATDTTFWFGFKDDIVIRITPAVARSLLDVRSVSRVGISDVGTNARRIHRFLEKVSRK